MKKLLLLRKIAGRIAGILIKRAGQASLSVKKDPVDMETVVKMKKWTMEKGWIDDCTMQEVAGRLGIRQEQLSLFFRNHVGKSFLQWRKEMRIEEAKRIMLEDDSLSVMLVGESVGIADRSNFRRQFKEITGKTPSQWRLEHQIHI